MPSVEYLVYKGAEISAKDNDGVSYCQFKSQASSIPTAHERNKTKSGKWPNTFEQAVKPHDSNTLAPNYSSDYKEFKT